MPFHAEDIIAQAKPTGKCFCDLIRGELEDARAAHAFPAAFSCKDINVFPGQCPSVACVCSILNLVTVFDMLHTT